MEYWSIGSRIITPPLHHSITPVPMRRLSATTHMSLFSSLSGFRCCQRRLPSKLIGHRLLDDGALEEVWVVARV
jgi:hypothetical protein